MEALARPRRPRRARARRAPRPAQLAVLARAHVGQLRARPPAAAFETSVHGVVVQTSSASPARSAPAGSTTGKRDVDRRVLDVLVALRDLVRGQRGAAARAVGDDLVALVEQAAVPQLRERPPHRLDVGVVERAVRVLEVDPVADPLGQPRPVVEELEHGLAALLVELGDAVALDVGLLREAELLLDRDLDRQAVAVPAGLALDVAPAHGLVAREDVLEHARQDVVGARAPVGRRRPLVEDPRLRALAAAHRLAGRRRARASARGPPPRARGTRRPWEGGDAARARDR